MDSALSVLSLWHVTYVLTVCFSLPAQGRKRLLISGLARDKCPLIVRCLQDWDDQEEEKKELKDRECMQVRKVQGTLCQALDAREDGS